MSTSDKTSEDFLRDLGNRPQDTWTGTDISRLFLIAIGCNNLRPAPSAERRTLPLCLECEEPRVCHDGDYCFRETKPLSAPASSARPTEWPFGKATLEAAAPLTTYDENPPHGGRSAGFLLYCHVYEARWAALKTTEYCPLWNAVPPEIRQRWEELAGNIATEVARKAPKSASRASLAEPRALQLDLQHNPKTDALAAELQNDASADDLGRLTRMKWHARQMEREAGYWRHVAEVLDRRSIGKQGALDTLDALDNQHRSEGREA